MKYKKTRTEVGCRRLQFR